jgi:hypothetical protein
MALAVPLLTVGFGAASAAARVGPTTPLCAQAAYSHRVGLVVEHGDGRVIRRCIGFDSATITAVAVLQASGLELGLDTYGSLGTAVCQIDHEPIGYTTCLPASGSYWVLFISHSGGPWTTSNQGASSALVGGGDDVGFRYDPQGGTDPPPSTAAGTCPPATTPLGTSSTPVPAATSVPPVRATPAIAAPAPTTGVLGTTSSPTATSPNAGTTPAVALSAGSPINLGLLAGVCAIGGLLGLLGAQALRRRRR